METARLVPPSERYLHSYLQACREFKDNHVVMASTHDPDEYDCWRDTIFQRFENDRLGIGLPPGYIPATTFWLVEGEEYIGSGNIRHYLTESLEKFGGHIGYCIRPSKWNQGYGSWQLKLLLIEANKLGINPTLITCNLENIASARVMEKNGAKRMDVIENTIDGEKRMTCRYWANTDIQ